MTYTTVQGDMWDSIAKAQYGDTKFTDVLINANPQYREIFIFSSGIVLDIPEINDKVTADDFTTSREYKNIRRKADYFFCSS